MKMTLADIAKSASGRLMNPRESSAVVRGISTDSRSIRKGELFVALKGANHDGHKFLKDVYRRGVLASVVDRPSTGLKNLILVKNTERALGDIAHAWRMNFSMPVIAVTGSNGKTTTKDLIAHLLSSAFRTLKTEGNFNNLIGLPLTLFRLTGREEMAVIEMGMNHFGEIDRLAEIAHPTMGVITNIGAAHLEALKSLEGVARAKGELLDHLDYGVAVLNADDSFYPNLKKRAVSGGARVVSFGLSSKADYRASKVVLKGLDRMDFEVASPKGNAKLSLPMSGQHNVLNALAAVIVAREMGISFPAIARALKKFKPATKRMEMIRLDHGVEVINDCYNANPDSTKASLRFLRDAVLKGRRRIAILGDMLELGKTAVSGHRSVGEEAALSHVDLLIGVGPHAHELISGACRSKKRALKLSQAMAFETVDESLPVIRSLIRPKDLILIKGSRGMKMERITEALRGGTL